MVQVKRQLEISAYLDIYNGDGINPLEGHGVRRSCLAHRVKGHSNTHFGMDLTNHVFIVVSQVCYSRLVTNVVKCSVHVYYNEAKTT